MPTQLCLWIFITRLRRLSVFIGTSTFTSKRFLRAGDELRGISMFVWMRVTGLLGGKRKRVTACLAGRGSELQLCLAGRGSELQLAWREEGGCELQIWALSIEICDSEASHC